LEPYDASAGYVNVKSLWGFLNNPTQIWAVWDGFTSNMFITGNLPGGTQMTAQQIQALMTSTQSGMVAAANRT